MDNTTLTNESKALFEALVKDAGNWAGEPMLGGNVPSDNTTRGNITDLKRKGLIETFRDAGDTFVIFTDNGKEYANSIGLHVYDYD